MMAGLAKIGIRVYIRSTMRTNRLANRLSTLGTEHSLWLVYGTTIGAMHPCSLLLLGHLHLLGRLLRPHRLLQDLLRASSPLCLFIIWIIINHDDSSKYNIVLQR